MQKNKKPGETHRLESLIPRTNTVKEEQASVPDSNSKETFFFPFIIEPRLISSDLHLQSEKKFHLLFFLFIEACRKRVRQNA